jgi:RNA polymerase sigma factor (sigma-70 family)
MKETRNLIAWSETLNDCLKKLSGESQKILLLRYEGERNCSEVASLMGISLDSVYKRLSRIHLKLRDCVNTTAGMNSPSRRIINES